SVYLSKAQEAGRIIKPVAAAIKAEILLTAASPLFNGNPDYANFVDDRGIHLVNSEYDAEKWVRAAEALEEAIAAAEELGENALYTYELEPVQRDIPDSLRYALNIRNAFTNHWNPEVIWAYTNSTVNQSAGQPKIDPGRTTVGTQASLAPTLEMAELFYSNNGVPIEEDKTYDYADRFGLQKAVSKDRYYIREGETTAKLHYNREPRYYGSIGFDRGVWYGNGRFSGNANDYFFIKGRAYEVSGRTRIDAFSVTGLFVKKIVSPTSLIEQNRYAQEPYHWPIYRLSALYLAYAEALNEAYGNTQEVFDILDRIRSKYGLPGVREAWATYSTKPDKPNTKEGLREIIQRERLIELAFEGQNFWDIRRWRRGATYYTRPTRGFDIRGISAEDFNKPVILNNRVFVLRDYLWPIAETTLIRNRNLAQNPGW
ncbi:RagB/SusD family nutrient uptake outer membrane protein, partial [Parapedobacter sp.]